MKFLIILISLIPLHSNAFFSTGESGEITPKGTYRVGVEPQFKLSEGSGTNFTAFFDSALNDESSWRAHLGIGDTDFYAGGSYKWIPYPNFGSQPAMGLKFEAVYGRKASDSIIALRVHPLISKKFETDIGHFSPYASIPVGLVNYQSSNTFQLSLVAGSEYRTTNLPKWGFAYGEEWRAICKKCQF